MFSFLLLTWLFVGALAVDDGKTYFTNPPPLVSVQDAVKDMPAYELGSIQKITWMTTLNVFNISIWQRLGNDRNLRGGNIYARTPPLNTDPISSLSWVVQPYSLDLDSSTVFFLAIESTPDSWTTTFFNITPSSSSSSSPSPSSSSTENNDNSPTSSSSTSTTADSGLTSTGKIALGLGAGIGAPLITLLAILAYFQYRSMRRGSNSAPTSQYDKENNHSSHMGSGVPPGAMSYHSVSPAVEQLPLPAPAPAPPAVSQSLHAQSPQHLQPPQLVQQHLPAQPQRERERDLSPSELPGRLPQPVHFPPWEVHSQSSNPRSGSRDTTRSPRNASISGSGSSSSNSSSSGSGGTRGSRPGPGSGPVRASGLGIPELPGENFI